jgi:hypothetical protein
MNTVSQDKNLRWAAYRCPEDLWETVRILAVKRRTSVQQIMTDALREYLKRQEDAA